ncbi:MULTISPECIES: purine-nucleoside phosphorylase [Actinomyces]|uniref:purine-nucleoside phosphorylase n=1 Tax=Actinomyces respiraculi TaxID=2744574 RepID=A0A7T0PX83_9ACTO|nr:MULTISPECIES: purine-nucleoside phosphorylase [Actinomyces]QPL05365.1 purine-nucleoside phosphorylase [Actinomyces respiraculi]
MAAQSADTWDEDPDGVSILLSTGRAHHDLLVVAEPALLTEIDQAWGAPDVRVRLSYLPGVSAPGGTGQEDALDSYDRGGLGVLVARGRTAAYEGGPAHRTTALARIAAGTGVRAALLVTRACALTEAGDLLAVGDHLNLTGAPLFPATDPLDAAWDPNLFVRLTQLDGVSAAGVVALVPGPIRPTPAESFIMRGLGVDAVVMDSVAEAMALASRGVHVACLACVDHTGAGAAPGSTGRRAVGRVSSAEPSRPAAQVVHEAVEALLDEIG